MDVVALATYSHGCEGRSPSLKTLIYLWNKNLRILNKIGKMCKYLIVLTVAL